MILSNLLHSMCLFKGFYWSKHIELKTCLNTLDDHYMVHIKIMQPLNVEEKHIAHKFKQKWKFKIQKHSLKF